MPGPTLTAPLECHGRGPHSGTTSKVRRAKQPGRLPRLGWLNQPVRALTPLHPSQVAKPSFCHGASGSIRRRLATVEHRARRHRRHRPHHLDILVDGEEVPLLDAPPSPGWRAKFGQKAGLTTLGETGAPAGAPGPITLQPRPELRHRTAQPPCPWIGAAIEIQASRRSAGSSIPSNSTPR